MMITNIMTWYVLLGLVWTGFLEYYTTTHMTETEAGKPWLWRERFFHCFLWPLSLSIFAIALINEFRK